MACLGHQSKDGKNGWDLRAAYEYSRRGKETNKLNQGIIFPE